MTPAFVFLWDHLLWGSFSASVLLVFRVRWFLWRICDSIPGFYRLDSNSVALSSPPDTPGWDVSRGTSVENHCFREASYYVEKPCGAALWRGPYCKELRPASTEWTVSGVDTPASGHQMTLAVASILTAASGGTMSQDYLAKLLLNSWLTETEILILFKAAKFGIIYYIVIDN